MPRGKKAKPVELPTDLNEQISQWKTLVEWMADAKPKEHALRQTLVEKCGFDVTKLEGSETLEIGWGYKLKAIKTQSYKATNEQGQMEQLLSALHAIDPESINGFIKWVPEISVTHYKDVILPLVAKNPQLNQFLSACITIKPGMPQLEMIPPKKEEPTQELVKVEEGFLVTDGTKVEW
jgi:hypothetical protein